MAKWMVYQKREDFRAIAQERLSSTSIAVPLKTLPIVPPVVITKTFILFTLSKKARAPGASAFVYPSLVRAQRATERGL